MSGSDLLLPPSRIFKKFVNLDDALYDVCLKSPDSTHFFLPFTVKMPYVMHRNRLKCLEYLVHHYWVSEIESVAEKDRRPAPLLIRVAFSWLVDGDKTFIDYLTFTRLVDHYVWKKLCSWTYSTLVDRRSVLQLHWCPIKDEVLKRADDEALGLVKGSWLVIEDSHTELCACWLWSSCLGSSPLISHCCFDNFCERFILW